MNKTRFPPVMVVPRLIVLLLGTPAFTAGAAAEPISLCEELATQVRHSAPANTETALELEHLPHTAVYMGTFVAGTAECQTIAFAAQSSDGVERTLPEPGRAALSGRGRA